MLVHTSRAEVRGAKDRLAIARSSSDMQFSFPSPSLFSPSSAGRSQSNITPFLIELTDRCKAEDIKVGSYPTFGAGVDVSLIGTDLGRLQEIAREVEERVDGKTVAQGKIGEEGSRKA